MTHRRNWLLLALGLLVCLPCLLPAVMVLTGMAALTTLSGWLTGHAVLTGLGASASLAILGVATWLALTRTRPPACSTEEASEL